MTHRSVWILTLFLIAGCRPDDSSRTGTDEGAEEDFHAVDALAYDESDYDFSRPELSASLPSALLEISALTTLPDGNLAAVQDEDGVIFVLDPRTGAVHSQLRFGRSGDYEGIAWAEDRLYVLRSSGHLFELDGWPAVGSDVEAHGTKLSRQNDAEGLVYDSAGRRLLIACKEEPGSGLEGSKKAIYAYDLERKELSSDPVYVLDLDEMEERFGVRRTFKPSGIAVHPLTRDLYVISSTAKAIAVLDSGGALREVWPLDDDIFEQPEGITFLPDGSLFIASEGSSGPPTLHRFAYRGDGQ